MTEVLILLSASASLTARELAARPPIAGAGTQLFGERVVTAQLTPAECAEIAATEGVSGVYEGPIPADAELPDDPAGRVAIAAWNARRQSAAAGERRVGEGAAWDDPRFEREGRPLDEPD